MLACVPVFQKSLPSAERLFIELCGLRQKLPPSPFPVSGLPPYCATLRLPTLGYTFVFPFGHALSRGCSRVCPDARLSLRDPRALTRSLPVDFATLHPSGCLRQSFSLRSIILPFRAPCGSLPSGFPSRLSRVRPFPLPHYPLKTLPTRRFYLDEKCFSALVSLHEFRSRDRSRDREIAYTASRSTRILA